MKRLFLLSLFGALSIILAACGSNELENTLGWEVQPFEATTQDGESFSTKDLEGKVWLANFIFTSCETICPPMTRNMAKIQDQLKQEGIEAPAAGCCAGRSPGNNGVVLMIYSVPAFRDTTIPVG